MASTSKRSTRHLEVSLVESCGCFWILYLSYNNINKWLGLPPIQNRTSRRLFGVQNALFRSISLYFVWCVCDALYDFGWTLKVDISTFKALHKACCIVSVLLLYLGDDVIPGEDKCWSHYALYGERTLKCTPKWHFFRFLYGRTFDKGHIFLQLSWQVRKVVYP
jgi:hypothetical protein